MKNAITIIILGFLAIMLIQTYNSKPKKKPFNEHLSHTIHKNIIEFKKGW
jgi:hypothetical protein